MEYIIESVSDKKFMKVNGTLSSGIAFLKIFESEGKAEAYIAEEFPHNNDLVVVKYEGFKS